MHKDLSRIATLLYDGVIFADDWHTGLDGLRGALGAEVFHFFTMDSRTACVVDSVDNQGTVGVNAEKLREYERHYVTSDVRMGILTAMPVGQIMLDHEHISARDMSRNPVYTDFLGRHGFWNTLGIPVRDDGVSRDFLGFLRAADRDHYADHERDVVRQLMPDLARAARLRAHTARIARQAAIGLAALDSLQQGIAVVDASGFCQHANATAQMLMNRRMLTLRHGRIRCVDDAQCVHGSADGSGLRWAGDAVCRLDLPAGRTGRAPRHLGTATQTQPRDGFAPGTSGAAGHGQSRCTHAARVGPGRRHVGPVSHGNAACPASRGRQNCKGFRGRGGM